MKTELLKGDDISLAAQLLQEGEVVAFPTETVYGLGALLFSHLAIKKIFDVKGRPSDNPLIAHISRVEEVEKLAIEIPEDFYKLAERFFPGPLTIVLKRSPGVPAIVSAGLPTIAVRCPVHPLAQKLLQAVRTPIAAPSANVSGRPSSTSAEHVLEDFDGKIPAILDGGSSEFGLESTVVSLYDPEKPVLLRPGSITAEQIEMVIGKKLSCPNETTLVASPGMKYRHYAPKAPVRLFFDETELTDHIASEPLLKRMVLSRGALTPASPDYFLFDSSSLYAFLRRSDRMGCDEVLVFCDETVQSNAALMNRLLRAAESRCGSLT